MIPYQIRSSQLINIVRDIKSGSLITDAYFQRNLVWREIHKKELIKTILDGYPFPLIFISKGEIDVERMMSTSCIVDGQQRTNAIVAFIDNEFSVNNEYFRDFSEDRKSEFFKYEIPVCELDIKNTDERVLDIFQRINRTSDSLTSIEKKASAYGASYFMLVCQMLCQQIELSDLNDDDFKLDPNIPEDFIEWGRVFENKCQNFKSLITDRRVFSSREIARKVNLQYTLNIVSTYLGGFYNRNDKIDEYLEIHLEDFDMKEIVVEKLDEAARFYLSLDLDDKSIWFNKANMFSLLIVFINYENLEKLDKPLLEKRLRDFAGEGIYEDYYRIAAKEGTNNLKERKIRNEIILEHIIENIEN